MTEELQESSICHKLKFYLSSNFCTLMVETVDIFIYLI